MKTIKSVAKMLTLAVVLIWVSIGTWAIAEEQFGQKAADLSAAAHHLQIERLVIEDEQRREEWIVLLARVFYSEYREGTQADRRMEWELKFSAIYNRLEYDGWWTGDFVGLLTFGCDKGLCEINGLPLVGPEALASDIGHEALAAAEDMVDALNYGPYEPLHPGHSWATPKAAATDSWFKTLCQVAEGPGHQYFADCTLAPLVSIAPQPRPTPKLSKTDEAVRFALNN